MGTVDADTLCGLPCSYYLDYNNFVNVPTTSIPGADTAAPGSVLSVDANGDYVWTTTPNIFFEGIDGGSATSVYTSPFNIDGVSAATIYTSNNYLNAGGA